MLAGWRTRAAADWRWRLLLVAALLVFLAGCAWSIQEMHLSWSRLEWRAGALALLFVAPSLWLNALELRLCACVLGQPLPMQRALFYSNVATLSNLLPLPGSVIVRGGALMRGGASLAASSQILLAAAMIWLVLAAGISAATLLPGVPGLAAGLGALLLVGAIAAWIARRSNVRMAIAFVTIRIALLALTIARLFFCFAMMGAAIAPGAVAIYTVASILGAATGIFPAGLGISEAIAAALAAIVGAAPAAAFLSVGLNRLLGLIGSGLVVLWFAVGQRRD